MKDDNKYVFPCGKRNFVNKKESDFYEKTIRH